MVDDRSLDDLPDPLQDALVQAVQRQGLGLFASGGRAAFGPGGWHDTTLASALPIEASSSTPMSWGLRAW